MSDRQGGGPASCATTVQFTGSQEDTALRPVMDLIGVALSRPNSSSAVGLFLAGLSLQDMEATSHMLSSRFNSTTDRRFPLVVTQMRNLKFGQGLLDRIMCALSAQTDPADDNAPATMATPIPPRVLVIEAFDELFAMDLHQQRLALDTMDQLMTERGVFVVALGGEEGALHVARRSEWKYRFLIHHLRSPGGDLRQTIMRR